MPYPKKTMPRRAFLQASAFSILAAAAHQSAGQEAQTRPKNVLFIMTEDQGAQMGILGTAGLETPHMDALARQGTLFTQAFVNYPVCSPSKGCIYTGLHAYTNGIRANTMNVFAPEPSAADRAKGTYRIYERMRVADQYPTFIELLHDAGIYTGVSSKLHVAPNYKFPYDAWIRKSERQSTAQFIRDADALGKPWFFWFNSSHPHRPYRNSETTSITVDPDEVQLPPIFPDTPIARRDWAEYLDSIELADAAVGEALAALDETGHRGDTLVVFLGDHGPCYQRGKTCPYTFGLQIPLVFAGPGVQKDTRSAALVNELDLMPTLLDSLGLEAPPLQHGKSLWPLLTGTPGARGHDFVVGEVHNGAQLRDDGMQERTIYDGEYRLIYRENLEQPRTVNADLYQWKPWGNRIWAETVAHKDEFPEAYRIITEIDNGRLGGRPPEFELYHTKVDPWEQRDLVGDPDYADVAARLKRALREYLGNTGDRYTHADYIR